MRSAPEAETRFGFVVADHLDGFRALLVPEIESMLEQRVALHAGLRVHRHHDPRRRKVVGCRRVSLQPSADGDEHLLEGRCTRIVFGEMVFCACEQRNSHFNFRYRSCLARGA